MKETVVSQQRQGLTGKVYTGTFWGDKNVLYYVRCVGYMVVTAQLTFAFQHI